MQSGRFLNLAFNMLKLLFSFGGMLSSLMDALLLAVCLTKALELSLEWV